MLKKYWIKAEEKMNEGDFSLLLCILALLICGFAAVFLTTAYKCSLNAAYDYDWAYFLKRQVLFAIAGLVGMVFVRRFDYRRWKQFAFIVYLVGIGLILALLTPLGVEVDGITKWLQIGSIRFPVSEVVKITLIVWLAAVIDVYYEHVNKWYIQLLLWASGGIMAVLIYAISKDLISSFVLIGITFIMTMLHCKRIRGHLLIAVIGIVVGLGICTYCENHFPASQELNQIESGYEETAAVMPEKYAGSRWYQALRILDAVNTEVIFGKRQDNGMQEQVDILTMQNDLAAKLVTLEAIGIAIVMGLFLGLMLILIRIGVNSDSKYGEALMMGIMIQVEWQSLLSFFVYSDVVPKVAIYLPFISYGGASLFLLLMEMGIAFSVNRKKIE